MKVVHLISGGDTGGAKTHIHSLLSNISSQVDITMVCFMEGPFAEEARALGIPTVVFPGKNIPKTLKLLKNFISEGGYDIIHCHGARGNLMGALLKHSLKLPVVTTVHSDYRLDYLGRPFSRLTYGTVNTLALRCLDYRIGVSDAMVDLLISRGFDADKLFAIYNGLDFTPRTPKLERREYLESVGAGHWDQDSVIVGIAARLNPVKDIATLVKAFAKAHETQDKLRLLIAGDGEEMGMLQGLARDLGVAQQVCFAGWVSDVDSFYHAIDVNTLTSLSETFPYSLTEGARAGLPTVSSRVGGVPYLIDHAVTGFLFQPGDVEALAGHLAALAESRELREKLGRRLYNKAKSDFSIEKTISTQVEIYQTILRRREKKETEGKRWGAIVCGAYGRGNAGDDAILEAIVKELRGIDEDLPIWVMSRSPKATRLQYRVNAIYTFNLVRFLKRLGNTKLYINGGGSLMQDVTSRRSLWFYLLTISLAHKRGNKVLMYGCGIGPIQYPSNRRMASRVLQKNVDAITLRDVNSKEELENMGVTAPEIILSADPTVILPGAGKEVTDALMENYGMDPEGRYFCFSLRPWPGFEEKVAAFAEGARYVWEKYGLTPVFLPIEARLDNGAMAKVTRLLGDVPYYVIPQPESSYHTIGLFARMKGVLSMRLHALVFAAGQGVPLVGVVYDQKISSFLNYIGQDLYLDLKEVSPETLKERIDQAVRRMGNEEFLLGGVKRLRQVEGRNTETAYALLKEGRP